MAKFDEIQSEYDQLVNTKFEFHLDDGAIINLEFEQSNLPHLLGFQYLNAAHSIFRQFNDKLNNNITAKNVMDTLKTNHVTFEDLVKNNLINNEISRRINKFNYENIISLLRGVTTFKFIHAPSRHISSKAKFVFIETRENLFIHLYIGFDTLGKFYFPLSFQPSKQKEVSLERKYKKILKTIITYSSNHSSHVEVLDHELMRPVIKDLSAEIKDFRKKNDLLYKKEEQQKCTKTLLDEINQHVLNIKLHYNKLSTMTNLTEFFMRTSTKHMKDFFDIYSDKFNKH